MVFIFDKNVYFTSVHFIMWNLLLCILINIARFEKIPETVP